MAARTDSNLVNPWGFAGSMGTAIWVANNGTGTATLYNNSGQLFPTASPLVVTIPPPAGGMPPAAPTGVVFNSTSSFVVHKGTTSGPSAFLFATEDGTIAGWSPTVDSKNAILAVDNSASGAVYKAIALDTAPSGNFVLAANFNSGKIDVFDQNFATAHLPGSFTDPNIPAGFAPFRVTSIKGSIYVTYAKQNDAKHDDVAGPGNGYIDIFDTNGNLVRRFASQGTLNSPWGLAVAPPGFGKFSNDLLVGNFGDGRIGAFDPNAGTFLGQLADPSGQPIVLDGLWGLFTGLGGQNSGTANTVYFAAGIQKEQHGLFGSLRASTPQSIGAFDPATATWYLRRQNGAGSPDAGQFTYGAPGWKGLTGDWTAKGQQTVAVVDPATETWYIRNSNSAGAPDFTPFQFGAPGWIPVAGDWTGTGHTGIGVIDPTTETWYLRTEVGPGGPDAGQFTYGAPGWLPVVGDWTGAGRSGIGVVDPTTQTWYLRNSNSGGTPDITPFSYGVPGWTPVAGDWTGLGHSGIGVFNPQATWYLRNNVSAGSPDITPFSYGVGTWTALAGNFVGSSGMAAHDRIATNGEQSHALTAPSPEADLGVDSEVARLLGSPLGRGESPAGGGIEQV
jgi:uncharacterized protein (TIGR03118 family)